MIPIDSSLEGIQLPFGSLKKLLYPEDFHLGGGYKYNHGYLDKPLDWEEEHGYRYYLRIPVYAIQGELESEKAIVRLGKPFVIKHEFLTGNDPSGDIGVASALVNQFSKPIPTGDAAIDPKWISRATSVLRVTERKVLGNWQGR